MRWEKGTNKSNTSDDNQHKQVNLDRVIYEKIQTTSYFGSRIKAKKRINTPISKVLNHVLLFFWVTTSTMVFFTPTTPFLIILFTTCATWQAVRTTTPSFCITLKNIFNKIGHRKFWFDIFWLAFRTDKFFTVSCFFLLKSCLNRKNVLTFSAGIRIGSHKGV